MAGFQLHAERGVWQCLNDNTLRPEIVVLACDEKLQSSANNRLIPTEAVTNHIIVPLETRCRQS